MQDVRQSQLGIEDNFYISKVTNNQSEFLEKKPPVDCNNKVSLPDSLGEYGPQTGLSSYKGNFQNFIPDNTIADKQPNIEVNMLDLNFKGKSAYMDQFHQFKSKDYNDKYHKEEMKKAPFAVYAPFIDQTTNRTDQNRMAHHAARSFS